MPSKRSVQSLVGIERYRKIPSSRSTVAHIREAVQMLEVIDVSDLKSCRHRHSVIQYFGLQRILWTCSVSVFRGRVLWACSVGVFCGRVLWACSVGVFCGRVLWACSVSL
jgi:hypothetical protein